MNLMCSCHQGCESCCRNNIITIGYPEAYIIKSYIQSNQFTRKQREKVFKRIKEQIKTIELAGITQKEINLAERCGDSKQRNKIKQKYHELRLPCIFLDDGRCLIHKVRPMDCWAFRQYVSEFYCEDAFFVVGSEDYHEFKMKVLNELYIIFYESLRQCDIGIIDSLPAMINRVLQE